MSIKKVVEIDLPEQYRLSLNDRRNSREYYKDCPFGRRDIALLQYDDICNCFYEVNGNIQIDLWGGVEADETSLLEIREAARKIFETQLPIGYVESHIEFFKSL